MSTQQNEESVFAPPVYSQEIFATRNGSYKLLLQVHNFNGFVRVGITKQIWCQEANDYVHAKKGHCYFPAEAVDALKKYLPTAKIEADRLEQQVNGHAKPGAFAAGKGPFGFGASKLYQRRVNGAADAFASTSAAGPDGGEQQFYGKRRADGYKTDDAEAQASGLEQGSPNKQLRVTDESIASNEETIVPRKTQAVERSNARR
jgi:hypothetical protein